MRFEQIPNTPLEPSKEQPPYPGWVLENGIWRKPAEEKSAESTEQDKEGDHAKKEETDKELTSLEEELKKLDDKEYLSPDDIQKKKELEIKYTTLDKQTKETPGGKEEKEVKPEGKKPGKKEGPKKKKGEKEKEKEDLEREITEEYYDELEKIKQMPCDTKKLKKEKTERYFKLIDDWTDTAYLDNYKGIQNIFSELNRLEPSIFLYDLKKAQTVNKVGLTMALDYKEWGLEDKEKLKIIKNFVNGQLEKENIFYSKDKTFKEIAQILASEDIPFKGNVDVIVKNIENPDIKSKTIAEIADIEKESIEKKKQSLQDLKKDMKHDKLPPDEIIIEQLKKFGFDKEAVSKVLPELVNFFEDPKTKEKVQKLINTKEFQALRKTIEKITKQKEEVPDSITKAKEHIEKKESAWGTAFGAAGWFVTLILILFIGLLMKGEDYLIGQAGGGKKKEKK